MKKMYAMIRPNEFWKYGSVDEEGNYPHTNLENFNVDDKYNYFIFEIDYEENNNIKEFYDARILLSDDKNIIFDVIANETNDKIRLNCDYLGMYSLFDIKLNSIEIKPSKASGFLKVLQDDKKNLVNYIDSLDRTFELCSFFKEEYDQTINGPSKSLIKETIKQYKRLK